MNRPSLGRLLFAPEFGRSVRPLRQNFGMFVGLVAGLLAQAGLLSREMDGPVGAGLRGEGRLRLMEVLGAAYKNVRWTKEGLPQAVFFMAVAGMLLFGVLSILTIILLVISGPAAAEDNPFAALPAATPGGLAGASDLAPRWLNYLVQGNVPLDEFGLNPGPVQAGLRALLGFYSHGMLVLASIILLYFVMALVLETVQHGQLFGKRSSSLWTPIRLVFAIGLLVPLNGQLNAGQYAVLELARLSSNFASNAWKAVLDNFAAYRYVPTVSPDLRQLAREYVHIGYCMKFLGIRRAHAGENAAVNIPAATRIGSNGRPDGELYRFLEMSDVADVLEGAAAGRTVYFGLRDNSSDNLDVADICGVLKLSSNENSEVRKALETAFARFTNIGAAIASHIVPGGENYDSGGTQEPALVRLKQQHDVFMRASNIQLRNAYFGSAWNAESVLMGALLQGEFTRFAQLGWVMAGSYFNIVARKQGELFDRYRDIGNVEGRPRSTGYRGLPGGTDVARYLIRGRHFVEEWLLYGRSSIDVQAIHDEALFSEQGGNRQAGDMAAYMFSSALINSGLYADGDGDGAPDVETLDVPFAGITGVLDSWNPVNWWDVITGRPPASIPISVGEIIPERNPNNALFELSELGHKFISSAFEMWDKALLSQAGPILSFAGPLLVLAGSFTLIFGLLLALVMPLIPFIRFTFGILSWFVGILEAMIAVPLAAIAHLNPEGQGISSATSRQFYMYLLQIFLRPILMIFGLFVALLLINTLIGFINFGFAAAAVTTHPDLSKKALNDLIFLFLYALLCFTVINLSTKMIDILPENALAWMGASGKRYGFEGTQLLETAVNAGGLLAQEGAGAMVDGAANTRRTVGGGFKQMTG